jgi:threonine dehydrogenase-like Zn-dependent dehydrogenase
LPETDSNAADKARAFRERFKVNGWSGTCTDTIYDYSRAHALRAAIFACAKGGTVSIPSVYGGFLDRFPLGGAFAKGLTLKMGQTNVHRYLPRLLVFIQAGRIDPSFMITHRLIKRYLYDIPVR